MIRLVFTLVLLAASTASADSLQLAPEKALQAAQKGDMILIDIRIPPEWVETGLPQAAMALSLQDSTLKPRREFVDDVIALVDGNRDKPIALICARGNRSAFAQQLLAAHGFTAIYNVAEGMMGGSNGPGWIKRGLPTVLCQDC